MGGISLAARTVVIDGKAFVECSLQESGDCRVFIKPEEYPATGDDKPRATCRDCKNARKKRYREEGRIKVRQEVARGAAIRYAAKHREERRLQHSAYMRRVKADPAKHAAYLETRRIAYRLKREREGVPLEAIKSKGVELPAQRFRLPPEPLVALVNSRIEARRAVERFIGEDARKVGAKGAVCETLGIALRTLYRWEHEGERVDVATAERVLQRADATWGEIYSYDDHPDLYATVLEGLL